MSGVSPTMSGSCADITSDANTSLSCSSSTSLSSAGLCSARRAPAISVSSCLLIPLLPPSEMCLRVMRAFCHSSL